MKIFIKMFVFLSMVSAMYANCAQSICKNDLDVSKTFNIFYSNIGGFAIFDHGVSAAAPTLGICIAVIKHNTVLIFL